MAEFKFLSTARIRASEMIDDTQSYIARVYGRAGELFTSASPFSQILSVLSQITEMIFYYVEDSTIEQNILTAQNPESIYGLSRLAGHDSFRGTSSIGEIKLRLNTSAGDEIAGDALNIPANTVIKSEKNGLEYVLKTNQDQFRIEKSNSGYINIPVVQGKIEKQDVTGTGDSLQSFNIIIKGNTDHHSVRILVNSELWSKYDSLYDMKVGTKGYLVKTGISGGLDIYFGNGSFGDIPNEGATIEIEYIITDGAAGNLSGSKDLRFKFETEGSDSVGETYDLNEMLEASFTIAPKMGSDPESTELTKLLAPLQSHSFVLATPNNYEAFLSKYGMFSYLDAYNTTDDGYIDDDNVIYLFMLPDTKRKLTKNNDYFNIPIDEFFFSEDEKNGILQTLENSGRQMVTTEVKIVEPKVQYFRMDVKVRYFEGFNKPALYSEIRAKISDYLINITRRDRLPKSDIIALLEGIEGIDSVNVKFTSEKEETARRLGYYVTETVNVTPSTPVLEGIGNGKQKYVFFKRTVSKNQVNFEPNAALPENVINLDSFGDILLEKEEVALFRGDWMDRESAIILDDAKMGEHAALSIYFDEPAVKNTIFSKIQAQNRKAL
jgi:hypothetical protein|tara:strand:- start:3402 stop:5222 length:1821 start_codon:yes stop_codon:yes gene_type:complete